jgi:hypothetical protein
MKLYTFTEEQLADLLIDYNAALESDHYDGFQSFIDEKAQSYVTSPFKADTNVIGHTSV